MKFYDRNPLPLQVSLYSDRRDSNLWSSRHKWLRMVQPVQLQPPHQFRRSALCPFEFQISLPVLVIAGSAGSDRSLSLTMVAGVHPLSISCLPQVGLRVASTFVMLLCKTTNKPSRYHTRTCRNLITHSKFIIELSTMTGQIALSSN